MIEAGESDVAIDELRWLVGGCSEFIEAHTLLGELALALTATSRWPAATSGSPCSSASRRSSGRKSPGRCPTRQPANRTFFEAGRGLVTCLVKLDMTAKAVELVQDLVRLDPTDPLKLRQLLDEVRTGGLPIVDISRELPASDDRPV